MEKRKGANQNFLIKKGFLSRWKRKGRMIQSFLFIVAVWLGSSGVESFVITTTESTNFSRNRHRQVLPAAIRHTKQKKWHPKESLHRIRLGLVNLGSRTQSLLECPRTIYTKFASATTGQQSEQRKRLFGGYHHYSLDNWCYWRTGQSVGRNVMQTGKHNLGW